MSPPTTTRTKSRKTEVTVRGSRSTLQRDGRLLSLRAIRKVVRDLLRDSSDTIFDRGADEVCRKARRHVALFGEHRDHHLPLRVDQEPDIIRDEGHKISGLVRRLEAF